MLKVKIDLQGLENLQEHINIAEKFLKLKKDKEWNKFLQQKVLQTLNRVIARRLKGGTTNDDAINLYVSSNKIEETENGFILYNDATIEAETQNKDNYPNGKFSIALAFEYGVGIVGENTPVDRFIPWQYNVHEYNFGWYFRASDGKYHQTAGYEGFEIYRYTADSVEKNINKWVKEYYSKEVQ